MGILEERKAKLRKRPTKAEVEAQVDALFNSYLVPGEE